MARSPGDFCSAASKAYWKLDNDGKQQLVDKQETETKHSVDIRKAAAKIFKKVESQVCYIYIYIYM